jgi:hypothetical protein
LAAGVFLLLAACLTEDAASPLAPQAGAELSRLPQRPSPTYRAPDREYVEACLTLASRMKSSMIEVVIDVGNGYRSLYLQLNLATVRSGDVVRSGLML